MMSWKTFTLALVSILIMPLMVFAVGRLTPSGTTVANPLYQYAAGVATDTLVLTGPGVLHTLTCSSDAAATAGTLSVRDGVAAGGGTQIALLTWTTNNYPPSTLIFDVAVQNGIYLDFTTTADVTCTASFN